MVQKSNIKAGDLNIHLKIIDRIYKLRQGMSKPLNLAKLRKRKTIV